MGEGVVFTSELRPVMARLLRISEHIPHNRPFTRRRRYPSVSRSGLRFYRLHPDEGYYITPHPQRSVAAYEVSWNGSEWVANEEVWLLTGCMRGVYIQRHSRSVIIGTGFDGLHFAMGGYEYYWPASQTLDPISESGGRVWLGAGPDDGMTGRGVATVLARPLCGRTYNAYEYVSVVYSESSQAFIITGYCCDE